MSASRTDEDGSTRSVFVTVGTDHHPFDRLIGWIDEWRAGASAECFVQFGTSRAPSACEGKAYLSHDELGRRIAGADAIVCHGGPGTIFDCLRAGTMPIVVPRRHGEGEHVDDHQVRFTARLETSGYIKIARTSAELAQLLGSALQGSTDVSVPTSHATLEESVARFAELVAPLFPGAIGSSGGTDPAG